MAALVEDARAGKGPSLLVLRTYRLLGHSSADDPTRYRDSEEVAAWQKKEPMTRYVAFLTERGIVTDADVEAMRTAAYAEVDEIIRAQEAAAGPTIESLAEDTFATVPRHLARQVAEYRSVLDRRGPPAK
jgi:TPP-dependent pyruvate/acetoin dehydrogenase alpha subunit